MNKIFVYYDDGYYEEDGVGFQEFNSQKEAADFIAGRMAKAAKPNINQYTVIEGKKLRILQIEYATKLEFSTTA